MLKILSFLLVVLAIVALESVSLIQPSGFQEMTMFGYYFAAIFVLAISFSWALVYQVVNFFIAGKGLLLVSAVSWIIVYAVLFTIESGHEIRNYGVISREFLVDELLIGMVKVLLVVLMFVLLKHLYGRANKARTNKS